MQASEKGMLYKLTSLDEFYSTRTVLSVGCIVVLLVVGGYFLYSGRKIEIHATKRIAQGYGSFGTCYGGTRLLFLLSDYVIASNSGVVTPLHNTFVISGYLVGITSLIFLSFSTERYILNRKLILTTVSTIVCAVCVFAMVVVVGNLFLGINAPAIAQYFIYGAALILSVSIAIMYLLVLRTSIGTSTKRARSSIIGLLIFFAGLIFDIDAFSSNEILNPLHLYLPPVLIAVGITLFIFSRPAMMAQPMVRYYQAKRICVVCRGVIKTKVFICGNCSIFYCKSCKEAISSAENKCWNCGERLEKGKEVLEGEIPLSLPATEPVQAADGKKHKITSAKVPM